MKQQKKPSINIHIKDALRLDIPVGTTFDLDGETYVTRTTDYWDTCHLYCAFKDEPYKCHLFHCKSLNRKDEKNVIFTIVK